MRGEGVYALVWSRASRSQAPAINISKSCFRKNDSGWNPDDMIIISALQIHHIVGVKTRKGGLAKEKKKKKKMTGAEGELRVDMPLIFVPWRFLDPQFYITDVVLIQLN